MTTANIDRDGGSAPANPHAIYPPAGGPNEEAVLACTRAFVRGDFGEARERAGQVLAATEASEEEQAFAREVVSRTKMDPLALGVGLACVGLFFVILALTL